MRATVKNLEMQNFRNFWRRRQPTTDVFKLKKVKCYKWFIAILKNLEKLFLVEVLILKQV